MKPGRELDKAVAEAIGWTKLKANEREVFYWYGYRPNDGGNGVVPSYSTNIAAAMELAGEYRLVIRPSVLNDKWVVGRFMRVYLDGKIETVSEATGDTCAHAICLAVLEIEKEKFQ